MFSRHPAIWGSALMVLAGSAGALAAPEDVSSVFGNAQTVTLATGYSRALFDAPVSATIVTRQEIEQSGVRTLAELLQTVTSYYVSSPDGGRTTNIVVRGLESRVLILVDNVPLYQGLGNGLQGVEDIYLGNIERVEITRGPESALYGADAVGGIINIITRTSLPTTPNEIGAIGGTLATGGGYGVFGTPIGGMHLALYGAYNQSDQTNRGVEADAQTALDRRFHTHASLAPGPLNDQGSTTEARAELSGEHWRVRASWHNEFNAGDGPGLANALDPSGKATAQTGNVEAVYQRQLSSAWEVHGYLVFSDVMQTYHADLYPPGAFANHFPQGVRQILNDEEQRVRAEGTAVYGQGTNRLLMSLGAFTEDGKTNADIRNYIVEKGIVIPTGIFAEGAGVNSPLILTGREDNVVYGILQDEWAFAPDFSLVGGTRLDYYNHFGSQWSPRAALVWSPSLRTTWKAIYNEAFRPPSLVETQSNGIFAALGNPHLQPSKTRMGELQFGYRVASLELTVSAFTYKTNTLVVTVPDPAAPIGQAYVNGNSDSASGFDGELHWHARETLTLSVNGMVQSHASTSEPYFIAESPPRKLVNVIADWAFLPGWNFYVSGSGVFEQGRASTDLRPAPANYGLLNLTLRTRTLPLGLVATLRATNALDKYYVQPSSSGSTLPFDVPQPGRIVTLEVTKAFQ